MPSHEISPLVLAFLSDHIGGLEEFQVLMAVQAGGTRWWDAATVARELVMPRAAAQRALDHLARHNLLDIRLTDDVHYQFRPGSPELDAATRACADEYRRNPVAVLNRVPRTGRRSLRDFADAFRIRRDDDR